MKEWFQEPVAEEIAIENGIAWPSGQSDEMLNTKASWLMPLLWPGIGWYSEPALMRLT